MKIIKGKENYLQTIHVLPINKNNLLGDCKEYGN